MSDGNTPGPVNCSLPPAQYPTSLRYFSQVICIMILYCSRKPRASVSLSVCLSLQVNEIYQDRTLGAHINVVLVRIIMLCPAKVRHNRPQSFTHMVSRCNL